MALWQLQMKIHAPVDTATIKIPPVGHELSRSKSTNPVTQRLQMHRSGSDLPPSMLSFYLNEGVLGKETMPLESTSSPKPERKKSFKEGLNPNVEFRRARFRRYSNTVESNVGKTSVLFNRLRHRETFVAKPKEKITLVSMPTNLTKSDIKENMKDADKFATVVHLFTDIETEILTKLNQKKRGTKRITKM